ncbi:MAG: four-carbon acid sugar kinase family protein [Mucilaginibacter sp.]|uniref:four-carbon acid sugar kinase family protein n=1 Tax=Mucilaginibacter sp. TaxID=1882438 RepID=UPI0031A43171
MIAVIADDLTGAAELAGIGLEHGLKTEVTTNVKPAYDTDLLIIATDTRSLTETDAKRITYELTLQLIALKPQVIFKKIDSVLRGHIIAELDSQLEASGTKKAIIVPGNPLHNKKVKDGIYYYNNQPVHLSNYAIDPAFPVVSSNVNHMLRANDRLPIAKSNEKLCNEGITICEAAEEFDLKHWIKQADDQTIIAGASGLFTQLLKHLGHQHSSVAKAPFSLLTPKLFVFGSTFFQDKIEMSNGIINNIPVIYIPSWIISDQHLKHYLYESYANEVVQNLNEYQNAIIAVHPNTTKKLDIDPMLLAHKMGLILKCISQQIALKELLIEGGATAWAILAHLQISKLYPLQQMSPGVIRMNIAGDNQLCVTLKPGSYEWPTQVWAPSNL